MRADDNVAHAAIGRGCALRLALFGHFVGQRV